MYAIAARRWRRSIAVATLETNGPQERHPPLPHPDPVPHQALRVAHALLEDEDGREIVLAYLNPGEIFGEMCLFPEQQVRTAIVRTRTPTLVAEIGYQAFRKLAHEHPDIMFEISEQLSERLRDTSRRVGDLAFLDVAGRIAHTLINLCQQPDAKPHPRGTVVRISRQEMARIAGCSREMAGRVLKQMEEDGIISGQGRNIVVFGEHKTIGSREHL